MMEQTNLVPKRRFREFQDNYAWEQRELGGISNIRTGPFGSTLHAEDYVEEGTPIITTEHFKTGDLPEQTNGIPQVSAEDLRRLESYVLKTDDIVFSRVGSVDINALIKPSQSGWLFSGRVLRVRTGNNIDSQYLHYELSTTRAKNDVIARAVGQTMPSINTEILKQTKVFIPTEIKEQQDIGQFFATFDDLITLHQRKLDKTKALKFAYLSEMFPAEGESEPKRRFAGFTDAWEQRTVSELADRYDNLRVPITASDRVAGNTPYYGANGIQDYVEGFTHDGEFILVAEDGANDLQNYPVQYVNGKAWVNNHAHVLQAKSEIADNRFLMNALKQTNIEPYLVGGGRAKLNADVMMNISIRVPELAEQKQIGSFFANLDHLITLHQRKLEKLQNIKKAYLNEMFV